MYDGQLWLFVKLTGPAVIVGYLALMLGRNEGREIARHLPRGVAIPGHQTELFEIWLANTAGYFVSWMASCYSFGAISSAVRQITAGDIPSASDCFVEVRERVGPFVRLSLLLFVLLLVGVAAAGLLGIGVFWVLHQVHYRYGTYTIWTVTFVSFGLMLLIFSRFGLAVPALVLDDRDVSEAMFRSDELTERKWPALAILLTKSLIGGYVAGMLPFWLARWAWAYIQLPWWVPAVGSIAGGFTSRTVPVHRLRAAVHKNVRTLFRTEGGTKSRPVRIGNYSNSPAAQFLLHVNILETSCM